jgi:hypothetical protein
VNIVKLQCIYLRSPVIEKKSPAGEQFSRGIIFQHPSIVSRRPVIERKSTA